MTMACGLNRSSRATFCGVVYDDSAITRRPYFSAALTRYGPPICMVNGNVIANASPGSRPSWRNCHSRAAAEMAHSDRVKQCTSWPMPVVPLVRNARWMVDSGRASRRPYGGAAS